MEAVKIAKTHDVLPGQMKKFAAGGRNVLLANVDGTFHALDDKCPHLGGSLAGGRLDGGRVVCPRHGSMFDVATGKNVGNAKIAFISIRVDDAKSYPVRVEGEDVFVEIG
jgi:3-phenylpropionate/trans-cinnamate dioxygenase ferredoxin subunit